MGKFSDYLDDIKSQTDGLRSAVTQKSGVDCTNLSIGGVAQVVKEIETGGKEPVLQEKSVNPQTYSQQVKADAGYDGLSGVNVGAVTSNIDANITPTNIRAGVSILGIQGNLSSDKPDQSKTVTPTISDQRVFADAGYELGEVLVKGVTKDIDSNIKAGNIKRGTTILGVSGEFDGGELQSKTVTPTTSEQNVTADTGFYGLSGVKVNPVTSAIDSNILADNIKKDVTILGVTGTLEQGGTEDLTAELTAQDTALTSLESAVDKLPEPKKDRLQWKCDNVKSLYYEFQGYKGTSLDEVLDGLDTSQVTNMGYMFRNCSKLTEIPQIDTSNVTDMQSMCNECSALTTIPQLNTSNVTSMYNMFRLCSALTTIPQLDTSKVTDMQSMFASCSNLTEAPPLNTSNVTTMNGMFSSCSNLVTITQLDCVKVTSSSGLTNFILNCYKLTNLTLKNIQQKLTIGGGTGINMYGHLLTDESIINTAKELWDLTGSTSQKLTLSTTSNARLDAIYVKLIDATADMIANDEYITNKKPCIVCSSTDEGAMTLREYIISKNWSIAYGG